MFLLILKLTAFLFTGYIALIASRRTTAALRHILGLAVLGASLLIPISMLIPARALTLDTVAVVDRVIARPLPATHTLRFSWLVVLEFIWLAGTMLLLLRLCAGYWRLARIRRSAQPLEPNILAGDVTVPVASGLLRSSVLVPRDFPTWPEQQREAAIRHECAHIQRRDLWASLIANVVCALYWFHPLIWMLKSRLHAEQEKACDDAVIAGGFDRADYADALLAVGHNSPPMLIAGCAMTSRADLKTRITRVLGSGNLSAPTLHRIAAATAVALFAIIALAPVHAQTIYKVGGDVTAPSVIDRVEPDYTDEAKQSKISGTVILSCIIRPDGMAHFCSVTKSLDSGLDRNAADAVEKWHFAPATLNGEPVSVSATIEINFRLL